MRQNNNKKHLRGLYALTSDDLLVTDLLPRVELALRGGCRLLQYRDKQRSRVEKIGVAQALKALCARFNALLIINDDVELALIVDADGVHLGGQDGDLTAARAVLGSHKILGASCYAEFSRAEAAVLAGADYVAFGAFFLSPTKPLAVRAPLALIERCRAELPIPVCAIGGITLANAAPLIAAGANLLAVISDLFAAPDIEAQAGAYQKLFQAGETL